MILPVFLKKTVAGALCLLECLLIIAATQKKTNLVKKMVNKTMSSKQEKNSFPCNLKQFLLIICIVNSLQTLLYKVKMA